MPGPLFMPAMQGTFGNWVYYIALMALDDVVQRVGYAAPLNENKNLAEQIQRQLDEEGRAKDIADYLLRNQDRFFNALVVGVVGGQPEWHPFTLSSRIANHELGEVTERDQDLVGYLQFSGEETLFALDGQHRLAGIRRALEQNPALGKEKLALIFVAHVATEKGLIRTRSLFISLNKKVVPVNRKDIIILDEVDLAAIITRRIVDQDERFNRGVIDVERFGNAIPNRSSFWTTIGNFYDANNNIIRHFVEGRDEEELQDAAKIRLPENRISYYQDGVVDFYQRLSAIEPLLATIFGKDADSRTDAIRDARTSRNPRLLARPLGLKIITKIAAEFRKDKSIARTFRELKRIPLVMTREPFADVIWDTNRSRMIVRGESLATRLLLYMLGLTSFDSRLRKSYAEHLGQDPSEIRPPRRLPAAR